MEIGRLFGRLTDWPRNGQSEYGCFNSPLGHHTYNVAVLLFVLLISMGVVGNMYAELNEWPDGEPPNRFRIGLG